MKTLLALLCSLVVVASGRSQTSTPNPSPYKDSPAVKTTDDKAPAKKTEPAKKKEPKIEGIEVSRGERGFMGVQMVNGTFKISFYDVKKKLIAPDVARAVLRWDPKYKIGKERVVLNPGEDATSLSSPKSIRPPYNFKLFITLIKEATEAEEPAGETHVIDFRA